MKWIEVKVECYEGYRSRETPRRLITKDATIEITVVLDRWYEGGIDPGSVTVNYYRVRGEDGKTFMLKYTALFDRWAAAEVEFH